MHAGLSDGLGVPRSSAFPVAAFYTRPRAVLGVKARPEGAGGAWVDDVDADPGAVRFAAQWTVQSPKRRSGTDPGARGSESCLGCT